MGALGAESEGRDVAIGIVLAGALGAGLLLLHFVTVSASPATSLLFGNIFATSRATVAVLALVALLSAGLLAPLARPLLFASLHPELAEAAGVPLRATGAIFLLIVALVTAACAQLTGVLLVFVLTVAPAATAQRLTSHLTAGIALSSVIAAASAWCGIAAAYYSDWPPSAAITAFSVGAYLLARMRPA